MSLPLGGDSIARKLCKFGDNLPHVACIPTHLADCNRNVGPDHSLPRQFLRVALAASDLECEEMFPSGTESRLACLHLMKSMDSPSSVFLSCDANHCVHPSYASFWAISRHSHWIPEPGDVLQT